MIEVQGITAVVNRSVVSISKEWHIARAQWTVKSMAQETELPEVAVYSIITSVSELANNIFFHAGTDGSITIRIILRNGLQGIEIVAEDNGCGIVDVNLALQDGHSTNGGLGGGLPGVKRLMDEFEISSTVGIGTKIVARKWQKCV